MSRMVKIALCAVAISGFFLVDGAEARHGGCNGGGGLFGHHRGDDCGGGGGGLFGKHRGKRDCGGGRGGLFGKRGNDCGCPQPVPVCCPQPAPVCCPQPAPVCYPQPEPCCAQPVPVASYGCETAPISDCGCGSSGYSYGQPASYGVPSYGYAAPVNSGCVGCNSNVIDAGTIQQGGSVPPAPAQQGGAAPQNPQPAADPASDAAPASPSDAPSA